MTPNWSYGINIIASGLLAVEPASVRASSVAGSSTLRLRWFPTSPLTIWLHQLQVNWRIVINVVGACTNTLVNATCLSVKASRWSVLTDTRDRRHLQSHPFWRNTCLLYVVLARSSISLRSLVCWASDLWSFSSSPSRLSPLITEMSVYIHALVGIGLDKIKKIYEVRACPKSI